MMNAHNIRYVMLCCEICFVALRVLRAHGLSDAALQEVYRSVVVARLLYAASAWHGFTKASAV